VPSVHRMNRDLRHAIEDFFYFEAELLDDRRLPRLARSPDR